MSEKQHSREKSEKKITWKRKCIKLPKSVNKLPQTVELKTTKIYSLTVPESRNLKSRCLQGRAPPKALEDNSPLLIIPAPDGFWHSSACDITEPISASICTRPSLYVSLYLSSSRKDTSHWMWGHPKSQDDYISRSFTNCICKDPISK